MAYKNLSPRDRVTAVHMDFMRHPDFSILGGVTQIGNVFVDGQHPTAATNGEHVWYSDAFIMGSTRKQVRYLVGHENMHKALHHCTAYTAAAEKYPEVYAQAIDYVVNGTLERMDPNMLFLERPTIVAPLVREEFSDLSVLAVMRKLLDENKTAPPPMDVHIQMTSSPSAGDTPEEAKAQAQAKLKTLIEDALAQGDIVSKQLRGDTAGTSALSGFTERTTDWRTPLRKFFEEFCEGDDQSRYCPPNKRLMPLGILLPSHFSEASGEFIVACDTSGSMGGVYPVVFGEIARLCQQMQPKKVRVIWWDSQVQAEQVFTAKDYAQVSKLMKPQGGGGTTVSCVGRYIKAAGYKPKATIVISDGYVESVYEPPAGPLLWAIVDNQNWTSIRGKVLHISSLAV